MTKLNSGLWLTAAVALALTVGCGDLTGSDGGSGCTSDTSCSTGDMCHPVLKTCVPTCTGSGDCPSTSPDINTFAPVARGDVM